jgi:hypothetical protein
MELEKNQVLDFLREKGQSDYVNQAERELPEHIDTNQHAEMLQRYGLSPQELTQKFLGRGGIPSL